jgi:hypothetical protein
MTAKFIVVTRDKNYSATLPGFSQQFLNHIVVTLRPVPFAFELPSVNNVSHQIQVITGVCFEKTQQSVGLAAWCSQMQI